MNQKQNSSGNRPDAAAGTAGRTITGQRRPMVAVVGFGTAGTATAAALAKQGLHVFCFDRDKTKLEQLRNGVSPVNEPGLREAVKSLRESGRFVVTENLKSAIDGADVVFLCVGCSDEATGKPDFSALRRGVIELGQFTSAAKQPITVVIRTPLYPGVFQELIAPAFRNSPQTGIALNPPAVRQGDSLQDLLQARVNVIGSNDPDAARRAADVYHHAKLPFDITTLAAAEFFGQASTSFQSMKAAFANEISALCASLSISPIEMLDLIAKDSLLNTSGAFLKPGLPFGGLDMVRETKQIAEQADKCATEAPLLKSLASSNEEHFRRIVRSLEGLKVNRIGIYGLSVRSNTDEVRASAAISLSEALIGKQHDVRLYDPSIHFDRLYGSNWRHLLYHLPLAERLLTPNFDELLAWAQTLVLVHPPSKPQAEQILLSRIPVVNLSGAPLAA